MTHPPATCELCGGTGLYSPSALPCPKGCKEFDIVESLKFIGSMSLDQDAARLSYQAAERVSNLLAALSEAEQREKDARGKALEDAAKAAKAEYKRHCTGSGFDSQPSRSTAHSILEAIRALKDEVR